MQLVSNMCGDIFVGENVKKSENGFFENLLPFLVNFFKKEEEVRLIHILPKVNQLWTNLRMNEVGYLKINTNFTSENLYKVDSVNHIAGIIEKHKNITKLCFVTRKSLENLEVSSEILIKILPSSNYANVSITTCGMIQIPKNLQAKTFRDDAMMVLRGGYVEKCETVFANFTDRLISEFKNIFSIEPLVSDTKRVLVIPSKDDKKISKFYNRKFLSQNNTLPPAFYRSTGESPSYRHKKYSDPFSILWWVITFGYFTTSASAINIVDSNGREVAYSEAFALVGGADEAALSNQLAESSFQFTESKYETFQESVEATKFAETSTKNAKNKKLSSNTKVGSTGRGGTEGSCSGATTAGDCTGGSCGGGSCGGGCCSGGGCGGGGCGGD